MARIVGALLLILAGCHRGSEARNDRQQAAAPAPPAAPAPAAAKAAPIGSATMQADGTIVLMLRATAAGGALGEARFVYPPSHPQYRKILKHVAPLKPGEEKLVQPFADE
jgi:hypothetical protein